METLVHDLRNAWRALLRRRAVSGVAVLLIALGIGVNTAVFAVLDNMVFRKLAAPEPDRLMHFNTMLNGMPNAVPYAIVERLKDRSDLFEGVSGWADTPAPVEVDGQTGIGLLVRVDTDIHRVMGVRPRLGRALTREDQGPVAVISDQFWKERLGRDPRVLGRTVRAGNLIFTIVGVMPEEFSGMNANVSWDVAVPLDVFAPPGGSKERFWMDTVARLRRGVTVEAARRQLQAMWPRLVADTVPAGRSIDEWKAQVGGTVQVDSASRGRFFWRAQYERPLGLLLGMAGLVLLIVCANLGTVLLALGISRCREMAVRMALGAGRARLVRQALLESLLPAIAGGAAGLLVARWSSALGVSFLPAGNIPFHYDIGVDSRALAFAAALALFTALACGLAPALRATRTDVMHAMRSGGGSGPSGAAMRRALVIAQVALSAVLITGSLLFAITLSGVRTAPLGFHSDGVVALMVQGKSAESAAGREYFDELIRRLRALPGAERASLANQLPMQYAVYGSLGEASVPGRAPIPAESHCAFPDYFATLGTPVLQGREFRPEDSRAAIISDDLSRRLYGGDSAVGRALQVTTDRKTTEVQVVGVVPDMKYANPREPGRPAFYVSCLERWTPREAGAFGMGVAVRGAGPGLERAARREVDALGRQYVIKSAPLSAWVGQRMLRERMLAVISSLFGGVTLAVVAVGLYGLIAFVVATRSREMAIRMAVGAQRSDVAWLIARETLLVVGLGLTAGLTGAAAGAKLIGSYLLGVRASDPLVPAMTVLVLTLTAVVAAFFPMRRAVSLEPAGVLRQE